MTVDRNDWVKRKKRGRVIKRGSLRREYRSRVTEVELGHSKETIRKGGRITIRGLTTASGKLQPTSWEDSREHLPEGS